MKFFIFFLRTSIKDWKTAVYRFSVSYLVLELQSIEDVKIKAKSTDNAILVASHSYIEQIFIGFLNDRISKFTIKIQNQLKLCKGKVNEIL